MTNLFKHLFKISLIFLLIYVNNYAQQKESYKSIRDAIFSSLKLRGKSGPADLNWIDGGNKYSYKVRNDSGFYEIRSFDPSTLEDKLIYDGSGINFPGMEKQFNYNSFQWAKDSKHLVFETGLKKIYRRSGTSDYYLYTLENKKLQLIAENARTAELSPDGKFVGYERDNNMYAYDIYNGKEKKLTFDTAAKVFNGHYDWVYEEEFGQAKAWSWSWDNKYIAFWHFDESPVPEIQLTNFEGQHPEYEKIPIPLVGDPNANVKVGVVDVKTGNTVWVDVGLTGDFYIPRIYWTNKPNTLAVITLNRAQNDMQLFFFNVKTKEYKKIMEEKSNTWIDVYNFYAHITDMISFPAGINEFFWLSDRDGHQHVYRYNYDGRLLNQVTKGDWTVTIIEGVNVAKKTIYYSSTEGTPLERQLYSIKFDGSDKTKLSETGGFHLFNMSPNTKYYVDYYSSISQPRKVELRNTDGKIIKLLADNSSTEEYLKSHLYSPVELVKFKTSDGTMLDGSVIKPPNFNAGKKYPVIFSVYGGPGSQDVKNSFSSDGWKQWLAQQGYVVVDVNNRGNANYSRDFMKIVYKHLGKYESYDYAEFAKYLSKLPYVDSTKFGIMGTSYGGYISIYTILKYPGIFKVAISNSPVTDWRLYDDIYTERYMGLLKDNEDGYDSSSCVLNAKNLEGKLLIVHSTMDDNVHVVNTMQMLTALANAGKDCNLRIYPPGAHGAAYNLSSYLLEHEVYFNYLQQYLKGDCSVTNVNR